MPFKHHSCIYNLIKLIRFVKNDCNIKLETSHLGKFHLWFQQGVASWLNIVTYKTIKQIKKAVELDQMVTIDELVKYSSSAVDTLTFFYQIKDFWQELAWPEVKTSFAFRAKIIDDICCCSVSYFKQMDYKLNCIMIENNQFKVTKEVIIFKSIQNTISNMFKYSLYINA